MFFSTFQYSETKTMADLSRKRERERLKPRREQYWMRLEKGKYLGFRRGADTWHVRMRDRAGKQHQSALPAAHDYDSAKNAAEEWLKQRGVAPVRRMSRGTVREALETYLQYLRDQGREATAKTIETKFKQVVWDDPLATIPLRSLTKEDVKDWRDRLRERRQPRSINRIVRDLKAGLNRALKEGHVGDREAWALDPLADDFEESGDSAVILSPHHRKALTKAAIPAGAEFMRGLELTGARPGELATATVADLDTKHGTLRLMHRKGRPARLKPRSVVLSHDGLIFFKQQAKNKLPGARLFLDAEGRPWQRKKWAEEIRAAAAIVNARARGKNRIPTGASAYSFRHARISELLQEHGIDPLTVAFQTGTSIKMIEKYYFRFIAPELREKLAAVDEG
jgi:integrase